MPTCRACPAEIRWIEQRNGKHHPCDAEMHEEWVTEEAVTTSKRVTLLDPAGDWHSGYIATVLTPGARQIAGYASHFATCPEAGKFRKA